jgi:hypothetical protein
LSLVQTACLEFVAKPDVILMVAKDTPDDIVGETLRYGPVLYVVVAKPAAKPMASAAEPERAVPVGEDGADVREVQAVGAVE